ncbi:MAG: ADP-ribosylglycohydrolase family protein [Bacteroidota bacterium]
MDEKIKSCLITGALGDAFGSRFEQMDLPAGEERWEFSDDTQLTIATCEAILEAKGPQPEEIARHIVVWYNQGRLSGLGASTLKALVELRSGQHWSKAGAEGELSSGNGAAMRIAPLAFLLDPLVEADRIHIRDICCITHRNEEAYLGALAVVYAIRFVQNDRLNFIQNIVRQLPESELRKRLIEISQAPNMRIRDLGRKFGSSGQVVESVPLALYAAQQAPEIGIEKMMKEVVAAGGDTDTNCAIAGHIAGVQLGLDAIPPSWMEKLRNTPNYDDFAAVIREYATYVSTQSGIKTLF